MVRAPQGRRAQSGSWRWRKEEQTGAYRARLGQAVLEGMRGGIRWYHCEKYIVAVARYWSRCSVVQYDQCTPIFAYNLEKRVQLLFAMHTSPFLNRRCKCAVVIFDLCSTSTTIPWHGSVHWWWPQTTSRSRASSRMSPRQSRMRCG